MDTATTLMDTAENLARRRGFDAFSFADLATAAGIRKSSVHYHFPTKAELAIKLITRYSGRFFEALDDLAETAPDARSRMAGLIGLYRGALEDGQSMCLCVSFSSSISSLPNEVQSSVEDFRKHTTAWIAETFAVAKTDGSMMVLRAPEAEAASTFALLEGAQIAAHAARDPSIFDLAVGHLTEPPQKVN